jgi:hypothetical protein
MSDLTAMEQYGVNTYDFNMIPPESQVSKGAAFDWQMIIVIPKERAEKFLQILDFEICQAQAEQVEILHDCLGVRKFLKKEKKKSSTPRWKKNDSWRFAYLCGKSLLFET